jgi:hypothetical protein
MATTPPILTTRRKGNRFTHTYQLQAFIVCRHTLTIAQLCTSVYESKCEFKVALTYTILRTESEDSEDYGDDWQPNFDSPHPHPHSHPDPYVMDGKHTYVMEGKKPARPPNTLLSPSHPSGLLFSPPWTLYPPIYFCILTDATFKEAYQGGRWGEGSQPLSPKFQNEEQGTKLTTCICDLIPT